HFARSGDGGSAFDYPIGRVLRSGRTVRCVDACSESTGGIRRRPARAKDAAVGFAGMAAPLGPWSFAGLKAATESLWGGSGSVHRASSGAHHRVQHQSDWDSRKYAERLLLP